MAELKKSIGFRWEHLRKPLGMDLSSASDEHEDRAYHLIACLKAAREETLVGTGRLHINEHNEAQIRYLAVAEDSRRQGIGRRLVRALEERAQQLNHHQVVVNVRSHALPFYEALGYQIVGGPFDKLGGIEHYKMSTTLAEAGTDNKAARQLSAQT